MFSLLADLQKERGFPHPSRKKKLLKFKRESTCSRQYVPRISSRPMPREFVPNSGRGMDAKMGQTSDPSPVPLRLVKAPERDTLSPRERADFLALQ
jgi:hypothetical protein